MRKLLISALLFKLIVPVLAQVPVADFTVPPSHCQQQRVALQNTSTSATAYAWDFCLGDLKTFTGASDILSVPGLNYGVTYKTVWDQGNWYAFIISENNNRLFRLDFGNDLTNFPTVNDLGNPGTQFLNPEGFDIINVNGNWFGFLAHLDFSSGVTRLDFGNSLQNTPTAVYTGDLIAASTRLRDVKAVKQGANLILIIADYNNNAIVRVNYGNSFLNTVLPTDVYIDAVPGASLLPGFDVVKKGSQWVMQAVSLVNNKIIQLNFGTDLLATPTVEATYSFPGVNLPDKVKLFLEGDNYYSIISNGTDPLDVIDSKDLNPLNPASEVSLTGMPALLGLDVFRSNGKSIIQGVGTAGNIVKQLTFESTCDAAYSFSNSQTPLNQTFSLSGVKKIELVALNSGGQSSGVVKSTTVSANISPDISFTSQNVCAQNNINFTSTNVSGTISSYAWDFGDGQNSVSQNPAHVYSTAGNYAITLTVTAANLCTNFSAANLSVFNPPSSDFSLPAISPVCTNQNYLFTNSSAFDALSNPSWEWRVNGLLVSTQLHLMQGFGSPVAQDIRLKAILPGCSDEKIKTISTVLTGPVVNFSANDNCQGSSVNFTNSSTGADAGFVWIFGDGSNSSQTSPSHAYGSAATFQVTLTGSNSLGCQNNLTKAVNIYSLPQPDFSVGLPPFSCSNSPTSFQNNTPPLTDSNITGWAWQFGDGGNSSLQAPTHTYASANNFSVTLTATSNKGCIGVINKLTPIAASPLADFTFGPSCLNQSTAFTDLSSGGVQSRLWVIASSTFTTINPSYTFSAPGNYSATLSVTSANGCSSVKIKPIVVPAQPALDFTVSNACAGKNSVFTDATSSPLDAVSGWNWNFAGNSVTGNPASYNFTPSGTYNVKMTTTHNSGCKYTLSRNVVINPSPTASFIPTPDRGAAPLIVQFLNNSQQASQYTWKFFDKVTASSTSVSPIYTFTSLGDYSAELTASNSLGCSDVLKLPIKVLVPSLDLVMSDFVLTPDPVTGKIKCVVSILNNSNIPVTTSEVSLFLADKAVVNELVTLNLNPGQTALKTLSFTISPAQFDFSFLCAEINAERDVQSDNNKRCVNLSQTDYFFSPYPNPTNGVLQVDWISQKTGTTNITVYDVSGHTAFTWEALSKVGLNQTLLDLSFLTAGQYLVRITTTGSQKTVRFMRQ